MKWSIVILHIITLRWAKCQLLRCWVILLQCTDICVCSSIPNTRVYFCDVRRAGKPPDCPDSTSVYIKLICKSLAMEHLRVWSYLRALQLVFSSPFWYTTLITKIIQIIIFWTFIPIFSKKSHTAAMQWKATKRNWQLTSRSVIRSIYVCLTQGSDGSNINGASA